MPLVADRVKETTTTAGTGTLTLAGAATGFQSFSAAFGTGAVVYYVIAAGADWEIGIGTTGSGTLSRDTVLQSSNGDALVDWPAGTKDVFCAYVADRAVTTSDPATLTNKTIDSYTNNVGANSTHFRIKAGATLAKGDVIKAVGYTPGEEAIEVVKVASSSEAALGICEQALNTGNFGLAVVIGELLNVNTNGFTVNQTLYSNGSGGFTSTKPSSGLYQVLGWVVRANASNGVIAVNVVSPLYVEASTNTVNTAVIRDGSGNFAAGTITAALTGNATTATTATQVANALTAGSYLTSGGTFTGAAARTFAVDATDASTASKVVARDASGAASFDAVKLDGSSSGTVTLQGAATAGTWALTLPTSGGSSGQVLTTDGSGGTSWSTVGGQTVVNTTGSYNLTTADAGKLVVYTGTSATNGFFAGAALASGLSTGQSIDIANNTIYNIVVGGAQVFDSNFAIVPWNNDSARVTAVYPNGKVLVATASALTRFNADGTTDNTFTSITPNTTIRDIAISSDGSAVYVCGDFTQVTQNGNTVNRNYVVKLNGTTGIIDTSFVPYAGLNGNAFSVAVSGTTVAVSFSGGPRLIAFMNSTTGAQLNDYWSGQYGSTEQYGFQSQPTLKGHPTTANKFIAVATQGYYYIDDLGNYYYFQSAVFEVTTGGGQSYTAAPSSGSSYTYPNAVLVTASHIYWAIYSGYYATVYRLTIGTYGSGLLSNGNLTTNSQYPVSVFSRQTDGSIFVGTLALPAQGPPSSIFNLPANLGSVTALPIVSTITSGGNPAGGVLGQSLSDGSLLLCNVVANGVNARIAKTIATFEVGATIAYPPYMSGQYPTTGFTSVSSQTFRSYQTMRLQKMSNGNLLVSQRNTPYQ